MYGPQKGVPDDRLQAVDALLERLAAATDSKVALAKGAGAAGGLGFALLLLGAARTPGIDLVADAVGLPDRAAPQRPGDHRGGRLRLLLPVRARCPTASPRWPPTRCSRASRSPARCWSAPGRCGPSGVESAYAVVDLVGEEASFADPAGSLAALAERTARTWSR